MNTTKTETKNKILEIAKIKGALYASKNECVSLNTINKWLKEDLGQDNRICIEEQLKILDRRISKLEHDYDYFKRMLEI